MVDKLTDNIVPIYIFYSWFDGFLEFLRKEFLHYVTLSQVKKA